MFETAETECRMSKEEFDALLPQLRADMLAAQEELKTAGFPALVIVAGVDGAGKGETVNRLLEWFDPRFVETAAFGPPTDEEEDKPAYWRYWRRLPPRGRIGVFFGGWYADPIDLRIRRKMKKPAFAAALERIKATEKALADDGALIVKLWFHLSKAAQKKRLDKFASDPATAWRVTKRDLKNEAHYARFRKVAGLAVTGTDAAHAPWHLVNAADPHWRSADAARTLLNMIRGRLDAKSARPQPVPMAAPSPMPPTIFDRVDLSKRLEGDAKALIKEEEGRLSLAVRRMKAKGRAAVLVFEGLDAAGKGGAVRRVTAALDARDYRVEPIAAPTDEDRAYHYLWRFWRRVPPLGRVTIFDRSWYGRVLVERVEGFAAEAEWTRAFEEINEFEAQLAEAGVALAKFWLQIDEAEQLRRFKDRQETPYKRFKITGEDWRNREKAPQYRVASDEMITRTSTEAGPWTIVEADDKAFARLKVLRTIRERLEESF